MTNTNELTAKLKVAAIAVKETRGIARYTKATTARQNFEKLATEDNVLALIEALEAAQSRIAELEARTLTVKLPDYRGSYKEAFASEVEHHVRIELGKLAAAAGIKLQIEGE